MLSERSSAAAIEADRDKPVCPGAPGRLYLAGERATIVPESTGLVILYEFRGSDTPQQPVMLKQSRALAFPPRHRIFESSPANDETNSV